MSKKTMWSLMVVALAATMPAQQAQDASHLTEIGSKAHKIVDAHVNGVVTVNVVIKIEFLGQSQERRFEARGSLVSDTGLILLHDNVVDPDFNVTSRGRKVDDVKTTADDIKVVFGNEEDEQEAFLVGKDSKLGFAFLQVRDFDPKKRSIPLPDYSKASAPQVGKIVVTPNRLAKGFDYAPFFAFGWVVGEIKKPQKALLLSSGTNVGLPAYDLAGNLVGAHAMLKPSVGQGSRAVLLKGGVVNGAIQQAQKRAQKMLEEQKSEKESEKESEEKSEEESEKKSEKKSSGDGK